MALKEYGSSIESLAEFILASISEITVLVLSVAVEQESFIETACYLYRASMAIMELMATDYACQENAMEIFQSISTSVSLAKLLVEKCQKGIQQFSDPELIIITAQLEEVIKHIGECLSFIPPSTFGDQHYAESAVRSLSNEMQTAHFEAQASKTNEIDKKMLSFRKQPKVEPTSTPTEMDLYPISFEISTENPQFLNTPQLIEMLKSTSWVSKINEENISGPLTTLPPVGQYMEPMYETFFCPLTKKIMEDPVTIRSGVTFERKAIVEWFEKLTGSEQILCPTTGQKLMSKAFNENIALKTTIEQWKERNEVARIKVARSALSLASSDAMVLEAVKEVQSIYRRKPYNNTQVCSVGILPLLVQCLGEIFLGHDRKTYVAEGASPTLIKMVHRGNTLARSAAFKTLVQLSSYQPNANILIEAGIVQVMVEEMFIRKIHNEPLNSKSEAAAILANIFESGLELENLQGSFSSC